MSHSTSLRPFHLAVQVRDLAESRQFYGGLLGCPEGRSTDHWVDFDLFGHQFVCHLNPALGQAGSVASAAGDVDGTGVPIPHFGVVLEMDEWHALAGRLRGRGVSFLAPPHIRFQGDAGEQGTFFIRDPSGNALEFKGFADLTQLFATADAQTAPPSVAGLPLAGLDHVVLRTSNLQAMEEFYTRALGCSVVRRLPPELGMVQLRAGQSLIDIVTVDGAIGRRSGEEFPPGRNMDHFCLRVAPFDGAAIRRQLVAAGVDCGEEANRFGARGWGESVYLRDPEGNTIELKAPPGEGGR